MATDDPHVMPAVVGTPVHVHLSPTIAISTPSTQTKDWDVEDTGPPTCGRGPGSTIGQTCIWPLSVTGRPTIWAPHF
ncbi:hypothetical protein CUJ84_pRLN1000773 (plasmid) [Rhizobium leguminosarum]|uniref:Uncharacterized protein n=1 Tax=Rhizobium leguminosarum TaxID=384 RepID=A0A2K9ZDD2_RHILE|nr:hypothetical protein CUJ84_pRLN1000773 [Rhizobium leguminosarum]